MKRMRNAVCPIFEADGIITFIIDSYGCTTEDNAAIGFRDELFDDLAGGRETMTDFLVCIDRDACLELFEVYQNMEHRIY